MTRLPKMVFALTLAANFFLFAAAVQAQVDEAALGSGAAASARRLVEATAAGDQAKLQLPFTDERRGDWHYTPRSRDGVAWKTMSQAQRDAATALMRSALSDKGHDKVRALMALEITLRELESFGLSRDPDNYAVAIYGQPGTPGWGWRIEGHHLSLHFSLQGDDYVAKVRHDGLIGEGEGLWEIHTFASANGIQRDAKTAIVSSVPRARFAGTADHAKTRDGSLRIRVGSRAAGSRPVRCVVVGATGQVGRRCDDRAGGQPCEAQDQQQRDR